MIFVSGNPLDITALSGEYPQNSVENKVLQKLDSSEYKYRYDSLDQLKFELQLRKETVNAAEELNKSRFDFAVFHKSKCNEEYWDRTGDGGFKLKNGAIPSDAINDIFQNGHKYATECATAMVIVFYKALLNAFGAPLFNQVFPNIYLMNWHSIDPVLREIGAPRNVNDILLGDRGYFKNPDVDPKTPEWQGENVIILGDDLYYGHGIGITSKEKIIRSLNGNRIRGSTRSAYFTDSVSRPNYKMLYELNKSATPTNPSLRWRAFPGHS